MKKTFNIFSEIVTDEGCKWTQEDVCLSDFTDFAKDLQEGDEVVIDINSPGGSVTTGIAIANQIRELGKKGIHTTARVEGICASIATVIMCACDNIVLNDTAFLMVHNCWSVVQGDAETLRKEADIMEKMNEAILSFYRSKFDLTDEELKEYMDAETWFSGAEAENFKLKCEVVKSEHDFQIAACVKKFDFKNIPQRILDMEKNIVEDETQEKLDQIVQGVSNETNASDETNASNETPVTDEPTQTTTEEVVDEKKSEPTYEELLARIAELEKQLAECGGDKEKDDDPKDEEKWVTKASADKRVAGMQATMQKQINEINAQITDFQNQLTAKNEELVNANAKITSLTTSLQETSDELLKMTSAFEEKSSALEKLNSSVNAHAEELPTMEEGLRKCSSPEAKVAFLKSGKYRK